MFNGKRKGLREMKVERGGEKEEKGRESPFSGKEGGGEGNEEREEEGRGRGRQSNREKSSGEGGE
jgi:hypothetical protein